MKKKESRPPGDDVMIRCRRLGNPVPFSYCRIEAKGEPCFKILDCWYDHFMIEDYLREELTAEEWERLLLSKPPKQKVLTLIELIEEAKKRKTEDQ